jgi:hypothetical protein
MNTDGLKGRIDNVIEAYKTQADTHSEALIGIRKNYANDELRHQLQRENAKHSEALASISASLRSATDEVDALLSKVNRKLSAPVTDTALNALQVLRMRKDISAQELAAFKDRYGSNYSVLSALQEIANENGITIEEALEGTATGSDTITASGIINMLNDLQTCVDQIKTGIATDGGLLSVAVSHSLAVGQINALSPHLASLDSFAE